MGVSYGIDLGKLDVCFGGFSPTLMGDAVATGEKIDEVARRIKRQQESRLEIERLNKAKESELRSFIDVHGNHWEYVELEDEGIRIYRCNPVQKDLIIPDLIDGLEVVDIVADSLAFLNDIESIVVPDTVLSIGNCAFRHDRSLKKAILPTKLADFRSDWFRNCNVLEDLTLPGEYPVLGPEIFDIESLKRLKIGAGTQDVRPAAFSKSQLEEIEIDEHNPFMRTDGHAIYNHDLSIMAALVIPVKRYEIQKDCKVIAKKAFSLFESVEEVVFPDGLEVLDRFSLARTSIRSFNAPSSLRSICEKAFFNCAKLESVTLNEGLETIEKNAFSNTDLSELILPSTVKALGYPIAANTRIVYSGANPTFKISQDSRFIKLDESGGLYRNDDEGLKLINLLDPNLKHYEVLPGTVKLESECLSNHANIEHVVLPKSLVEIGDASFKNCINLHRVDIGEGLISIGDEAFLDTRIEEIHLPSTLDHIGKSALVTCGAHHGNAEPSLHVIEVDDGNGKFYSEEGLLLEKKNERTSKVVVFMDDREDVRIPANVDEISHYAFNGAKNIKNVRLSDRISTIERRGLTVASRIDSIWIDLVKPIDGHDHFELDFPDTDRGYQQLMLALGTSNFLNPEAIFDHYDTSIINASSFDVLSEKGLELYEQATRVIKRLKDPIFLSDVNRGMCDRILRNNVAEICVEMAKNDDRESIDDLVELGYLNEYNIEKVIDRVSAVQDASITGYLLELNRRRFTKDAFDEADFAL